MNSKNMLLVLTSIILFGISSIFRKLSVDKIHPYQLQIIAGLVYMVELPIWFWLIGKNQNIGSYNFTGVFFGILCFVTHIIAAVTFGFLMKTTNSIGMLSTMIATSPIITTIFSYFIFNEQITVKKTIGMLIVFLGISLLNL